VHDGGDLSLYCKIEKPLFSPRVELRTFSVLGRRDNHYTMGKHESHVLTAELVGTHAISSNDVQNNKSSVSNLLFLLLTF
ncbi:Uncharacterized protein APZ42_005865, partial [Daphnia magna]